MLPLLAVGTASAQSLSESPPPPEFSTTDRPLSEALMEFASETGADILYDPALVADIRVSSVSPDGSLEERLAGLLAGTSLTFSRLSSGTLVLVPRPVERTVAARIL
ncbi:MAG TPA: STN domain-containing protein, partial [Rhodothermales bacterium]